MSAVGAAGRGRGRGGGQPGRGGGQPGRGAPPGPRENVAPVSREERKGNKRNKQLAAEEARDKAEDAYFAQAQAAALKSGEAKKVAAGLSGQEADAHEATLFATQGSQGIQFDKYSDIKVETSGPGSESVQPLEDYASLSLPPFLTRNIALMNYKKPTPIQKHAVPLALAGCDLMCCAQTGSGKTAAFLVPVCAALSSDSAGDTTVGTAGAAKPRAIVMAPTRELASQIELEAQKLTNRSPLRPVAVYGGADQRAQARALAIGVDVIVATPGRLNDFVERGICDLRRVLYLVLDEADRMLDMGFEPQVCTSTDLPTPQQISFTSTDLPTPQHISHTSTDLPTPQRISLHLNGSPYTSTDLPNLHASPRIPQP